MAESQTSSPVQPVRLAAAKAITEVVLGASLSRVLPKYQEKVKLSDKSLLSEICYGTCRYYYLFDRVLGQMMKKPLRKRDADIRALLIAGFYQIAYMRTKAHAVVDESVKASRKLGKPAMSGMVNGVLRRFQREQDKLIESARHDAASAYALPGWLYQQLQTDWKQKAADLCDALLDAPPLVLRVNMQKQDIQAYLDKLKREDLPAASIVGVETAVLVEKPVPVEKLPGFFDGSVSVQDAGAQLAAQLLNPNPKAKVLDACAAPGGKTCHLLERYPGLDLTAIDIDASRIEKIRSNLDRLKLEAKVFCGDAANPDGAWSETQYDAVLLDVPCSATGVIRRHPDIRILRQQQDIAGLVSQQRSILEQIWPLLKPGGQMLYATCSLLSAENEKQIEWFLQRDDVLELPIKPKVEHIQKNHGVQTIPGVNNMDGFYYALLKKKDE